MKIAVVFPGIGYHADKPLLYYSKKLAASYGFAVKDVPYGGFEPGIKGDTEKMEQAFRSALEQSREILRDIDFSRYGKILFLSKSVGTAVAAAYAEQAGLHTENVFFTPVEQSFHLMKDPGIVFHGTSDPWMPHEKFLRVCTGYPYYLTEGGNHSLETGDILKDLENMRRVMELADRYIRRL